MSDYTETRKTSLEEARTKELLTIELLNEQLDLASQMLERARTRLRDIEVELRDVYGVLYSETEGE